MTESLTLVVESDADGPRWWCVTHGCPDGECGVFGWHEVIPIEEVPDAVEA